MDVQSVTFPQPPNNSLFDALHVHTGATLITGHYTKATLLHLMQSFEMLVLGSGSGVLVMNGLAEQEHSPSSTPAQSTTARRLLLSLETNLEETEMVLCVLSDTGHAVLSGRIRDSVWRDEDTATFEVVWSIDPTIVAYALDQIEHHLAPNQAEQLAALHQARHQFPVRQLDPNRLIRLSADIISFDVHQQSLIAAKIHDLETRLRWNEDQTRMMVHDIRAPLHTLLMGLKALLHQEIDPAGQHELIHMAHESAQLLHDLTTTATDALRLEAGRMPLNYQHLSVETLIHLVCEPFEMETSSDSPQLQRAVAADLPEIWGDRGLLERILTNLITNAIKYTPPTGKVVVTAQLSADAQAIELTVGDTGQGIALEEQPYIFERFYQAQGSDRRRGLGVGLYFCRVAVEAHGGTISLASTPGVGSMFKVVLPLVQEETS